MKIYWNFLFVLITFIFKLVLFTFFLFVWYVFTTTSAPMSVYVVFFFLMSPSMYSVVTVQLQIFTQLLFHFIDPKIVHPQ